MIAKGLSFLFPLLDLYLQNHVQLRIARYLEPFTLAIAQLAYEGDEGPELAYRIERFGK